VSKLYYVPYFEFKRAHESFKDPVAAFSVFADLCRINALYMIAKAGSGHIGSSFSSLDMVSWLYNHEMKLPKNVSEFYLGLHDIYFSSKGHDAPGLYAALIGMGFLAEDKLHHLRRLGGLPGHPDIETPFIETNTGSLGMGLSKAKGMILANRLTKKNRRVFLLTGDGEWQEGQSWEALTSAACLGLHELTVIIDHNKIQSDIWIDRVSPLGDLRRKLEAFGWRVYRSDGHDPAAFARTLDECRLETHKPKIIIADTVKGKGVSFMESSALNPNDRLYLFHSGAPSPEHYEKAFKELLARANARLRGAGLHELITQETPRTPAEISPRVERLVSIYSEALVEAASRQKNLVALDADLAKDCGLLEFEKSFPERFIECGIAEQDMVSQAGGLALQGVLPVVHSFASFLTSRANEQIFNNATEKRKIIYVGSLAGLLPAVPGHSHQAVRDIAALTAMPNLVMIQPASAAELRVAWKWSVFESAESVYLRLSSLPWELPFEDISAPEWRKGRGHVICPGSDAVLISYGPVMLSQGFLAAQSLKSEQGFSLCVVNLPWLNCVDSEWLESLISSFPVVFTLDDHSVKGGQGQMLAATIASLRVRPEVVMMGVEGIPMCGLPEEILKAHHLDATSISRLVASRLQPKKIFQS
jgi:transketolase